MLRKMSEKKEALTELLECTWRPDLKVMMIVITHTAVCRHALGDYRETVNHFFRVFVFRTICLHKHDPRITSHAGCGAILDCY